VAFVTPREDFLERDGFDLAAVAKSQDRVDHGATARLFVGRDFWRRGLASLSTGGLGSGFPFIGGGQLAIGGGRHEDLYKETLRAVLRPFGAARGISGQFRLVFSVSQGLVRSLSIITTLSMVIDGDAGGEPLVAGADSIEDSGSPAG